MPRGRRPNHRPSGSQAVSEPLCWRQAARELVLTGTPHRKRPNVGWRFWEQRHLPPPSVFKTFQGRQKCRHTMPVCAAYRSLCRINSPSRNRGHKDTCMNI